MATGDGVTQAQEGPPRNRVSLHSAFQLFTEFQTAGSLRPYAEIRIRVGPWLIPSCAIGPLVPFTAGAFRRNPSQKV